MKTDNQELVKCIEACLDLSMDERLTQTRQNEMLALGKRLRGSLVNLLTAEFPDSLKQVEQANKQLQQVNQDLADRSQAIEQIADTISKLSQVVKVLDGLLKFAILK
jgi:ABC-type transporter Mla subunit MlaD